MNEMFLQEFKKALFPLRPTTNTRSSIVSQGTSKYLEFTEPSPEMRAVVRRRRLGLPRQSEPRSGEFSTIPAAYYAYPIHKRASTRAGLASSEAMILTRFVLAGADKALLRLLGGQVEGRSVLDFDLAGLELAWHSDLIRALEDRAAIWSMSRLVQPTGDLVLEHIVVPGRTRTGQLSFVGWYHRVGGTLDGDPIWSEVISVGRERRGQRISGCLPEAALPDLAISDPSDTSGAKSQRTTT
jgi:hypothetical protein